MPESTLPVRSSDAPVDAPVGGGDQVAAPDAWPARCTLAQLARILTMMYGPRAPTESSLKKWSSTGVFTSCTVVEPLTEQHALPSFTREALMQPRRAGRPGLSLDTRLALDKVYEQWPHLADSTPNAVFDFAVAQMSDRLQEAIKQLAPAVAAAAPAQAPAAMVSPAPAHASSAIAPAPAGNSDLTQLDRIEQQLATLVTELAVVKREVAQFSSLRNNLLTKLDDTVMRAQQALSSGVRGSGGVDPLVEAKRERDMGVLKSMMSEILGRLDRQ